MATTFPTYPATTFEQAVELAIFSSNQLHNIINADATSTVETEDGDISSVRKALVDNLYFKSPLAWTEGNTTTVFNQLYYFYQSGVVNGYYYAPTATDSNPVEMNSTPVGDDNWVLYSAITEQSPTEVYPYTYTATASTSSVTTGYDFDTAIVTVNGVVLVPSVDYTITDSTTITLTNPIGVDTDTGLGDVLFAYLGKIVQGSGADYATYTNLAKSTGASIVGTSDGSTIQEYLNTLKASVDTLTEESSTFIKAETLLANNGSSNVRLNSDATVEDVLAGLVLESLEDLRLFEPSYAGQKVEIKSRASGWSATTYGQPWGGGLFIYLPNLTSNLMEDDGGSIVKTTNGSYWVRDSLFSNTKNEIYVEWYMTSPPSLNVDQSDALQSASNAASLRSNNSPSRKVMLVMPSAICIAKTVTFYTRGVSVEGNNGWLQVDSSGSYTAYTDLSTNSNITTTPDGAATITAAISLTHGDIGGVSNPAYSNQEFIKNLNFSYGSPTSASNIAVSSLTDSGVTAICHWGTSTVGGSQGSFRNLSFQGFGIGYINGNNVWGNNFYECKWATCYIPVMLIEGTDNSERMNFFGCVMQNGYRCIYSPWGGDVRVFGGSYVWNTGIYFHIPKGGNMWSLQPSRIERVNTTAPLIVMSTSIETGATAQNFPMCILSGAMILLDASSLLDSAYLFSVGKYCKIVVRDNTWSNKNMTNLANLKMLNSSDTGGKFLFTNNTCRVGIFSEMGRDNRLLTSRTAAGRLSDITIGGANSANASYSVSGSALTFKVNTSGTGTMTLLIRVPVDLDMSDWDSLSWKANFTARSLTNSWNIQAYASVTGTSYSNNRTDLGSTSLSSASDITDVCSTNSYGYRKILKRADGGWDRVPTEMYLYITSADSTQTAGETFTLTSLGLLGY